MATNDERFALHFSDGSFSVLGEKTDEESARRECAMDDPREHDPKKRARLVRVRIEVIATISDLSPNVQATSVAAGKVISQAQSLSCDDQYAIANAVAANVGYVLAPEPPIDQ